MNDKKTLNRKQREREFHNREFTQSARSTTEKYYAITSLSYNHYSRIVSERCSGKRILEIGCGPEGSAFNLSRLGASVTAIDISEVAVQKARETAERQEITAIDFRQMDAERLEFPDCSFDLIIGSGILHHLDLRAALSEVVRTIRPRGQAVFLEPLGHNPLIRLYRRLTPEMRSSDEHPLLIDDFKVMREYFGSVEEHPYHLCSLSAVMLRNTSAFKPALLVLEAIDKSIFRAFSIIWLYAWRALVVLSEPLGKRLVWDHPAKLARSNRSHI
jgi:SAM-dependent methyltransferase